MGRNSKNKLRNGSFHNRRFDLKAVKREVDRMQHVEQATVILTSVCLIWALLFASGMVISPVYAQSSTVASTELINFTTFSAYDIDTWISLCDYQNITEFTLRIPAWTDWQDETLSSTYETVSLAIIADAATAGIDVNIDFHTWYTTWDTYFDSSASGYATYRAQYLNFLEDAIPKLNQTGVTSFMVLNEPQAQTATASENQFIIDCLTTASGETNLPVSVRFMGGYSPLTGHYSSGILNYMDFICLNTYWNPQEPSTTVYGMTESKMETAIQYCQMEGLPLWITEFGKTKTDTEAQRDYVEGWVTYANSEGINKIFCWVSSPENGASESYNIFNGWNPYPAFNELGNPTEPGPTPTPTPTPEPTPTATPTPYPDTTDTPTLPTSTPTGTAEASASGSDTSTDLDTNMFIAGGTIVAILTLTFMIIGKSKR